MERIEDINRQRNGKTNYRVKEFTNKTNRTRRTILANARKLGRTIWYWRIPDEIGDQERTLMKLWQTGFDMNNKKFITKCEKNITPEIKQKITGYGIQNK